MRNILEAFANQTIDQCLFDCKIWDGDMIICEGIGRLHFAANAELAQVEVIGPNNNDIGILVGLLQPKFSAFRFEAVAPSGCKTSAKVRQIKCDTYHARTNRRTWRFSPEEIVLQQEALLPDTARVDKIPTQVESLVYDLRAPIFYDSSETKTTGFQESIGIRRDWTRFTFEGAEIKIGQGDGKGSKVEIVCEPESTAEQASKILDALLQALSMRVGGAILPVGKLITQNGIETLTLYIGNKGRSRHSFCMAPISYNHCETEDLKFLQIATSYFFRESNSPIYFHLNESWNSELLSWRNRQTMVGTAVEAICSFVLKKFKPADEWTKEMARKQKLHHEVKERILVEIDRIEWEPEAAEAYKRVRKGIQEVRLHFTKDSIRHAGQILAIDITEEEIAGWARMRNAAAHGRIEKNLSRADEEKDLIGAITLLNKLTLRAIGWEDQYCDYAAKIRSKPLLSESRLSSEL